MVRPVRELMQDVPDMVPIPIRLSAVLLWATTVGFGVSALFTIRSLLAGRGLPIIMGFRAFGGGAFERQSARTMVALLLAFLILCLLEDLAGLWLWRGEREGAVLAIGLLPVGTIFWWGFALPIPPAIAVARTILIAFGWQRLT